MNKSIRTKQKEDKQSKKIMKSPVVWGMLASIMLFAVYLSLLSLANSLRHAFQQFLELWYWMVPLVIGFGIQVGLYRTMKNQIQQRQETLLATTAVTTAGGISTTSMIACCAHHVTDVLPLLGLSAAALFLSRYQQFFLLLGVLSNITGIVFMLSHIQKHTLYHEQSIIAAFMRYDLQKLFWMTLSGSILILITSFVLL